MGRKIGKVKQRNFPKGIKVLKQNLVLAVKRHESPKEEWVNEVLLNFLQRYLYDFKERIELDKSKIESKESFVKEIDKLMFKLEKLKDVTKENN